MVDSPGKSPISRRAVLRGALLGVGAVAAFPLLDACAGKSGGSPTSNTTGTTGGAASAGGSAGAAPGSSVKGAASPAAPPKGDIEVGVLYQKGSPYYDAYQRVGDELLKESPGSKITYTFANTEARPKLELRWKQGDPPDIDYVFNSADRTATHYVTDGDLLDLTSRMQSVSWGGGKTWADALLPAFSHFAKYNDKIYMAPDEAVVIGLYYNGKYFDQKSLKPPATWSDLVDIAKTIRADGVSPIAVTGTFQPYMGLWWDYLLLREVGSGPVMDVAWNGKKLADQPGALNAANKIAALVKDKAFLDGFAGIDFTAAQAAFFQGKAAMILMGSWLQGEMKASIPEGFDLRVTPFPTVAGGAGDEQGLFGTVLGESVWAKSKDPDLAVEYLRLTDAKDEQTKRVHDLGIVSPYQGVPGPPGIKGTDTLMAKADSGTVTYYYYGITDDAQRTQAWYNPVSQLFLGKTSPQDMVASIDSGLSRISH